MHILLVRPLDDGGMGSLELHVPPAPRGARGLVHRAAEVQFVDADGVAVIVSLYIDSTGLPVEMDVWKTDFSPPRSVPERFQEEES